MTLLLDSHAVLWALADAPQLSSKVRDALLDPAFAVFVSPVSAYELAFKAVLGKLPALPVPLAELVAAQGFTELPVRMRHMQLAAALPLVSRDAWDRILAAQAISEDLALVSKDNAISALGAVVFW